MTERERRLLVALTSMVDQYLEPNHEGLVDNKSMGAGEKAILVLAEFGLMDIVNSRFGRWNDAGYAFMDENPSL
jgi:hypothetical protein